MVGSLFADTIKYTYKGELKVKEDVTFKRADDKYIHYITSSKSFSKIECYNVVEIISENGDKIDFTCSEPSAVIKNETRKISSCFCGFSSSEQLDSSASNASLLIIRSLISVT